MAKLPAVKDAGLETRGLRNFLGIPYIRRDCEDIICAYLDARRPVLLIGPSMVGKTTMAASIISQKFGACPIAIPDRKTAFADLIAQDVTLKNAVIWLDDIDKLMDEGDITEGILRRLVDAGNVIVGTIRFDAYNQCEPTDQVHHPHWSALNVFEHVFIEQRLTPQEEDRLAALVTDPETRERIRAVGLGQYAGAAKRIEDRLKYGKAGNKPLGYALVLAAADWRRCGMTRPVPISVLRSMAESQSHLSQRDRLRFADEKEFQAELEWATCEFNPTVSLLQPAASDSYSLYDYALDWISGQGASIPERNWDIIIAEADIAELVALGYTAEYTHQHHMAAIKAWRQAVDSGDAVAAPAAAVGLAMLLHRRGDIKGAEHVYRKAINSGVFVARAMAAVGLGRLLKDQGDIQGAMDAWQTAINSGYPEAAVKAASALGMLRYQLGDAKGAKDVWQTVVDSGAVEAASVGAVAHGMLLLTQGDVQGAKDAWRKATNSEDAEVAPMAAIGLGGLLKDEGDIQGAKDAYQKAINSEYPEPKGWAALSLGDLLHEEGDAQGAKDAWRKAIDSGVTVVAPMAAVGLGGLLKDEGDIQGAKDAYQKAINSGHGEIVTKAAAGLWALLLERGDIESAVDFYQNAINSENTEVAAIAAIVLGTALHVQGDRQGAKDSYQKAIDSGHGEVAAKAALSLGDLLREEGDAQGAKDAYQKAIDSGRTDTAARATAHLRELLR